ncbi:unnamed protein product [Thelazia callipaeda]|uniref:EB domain-containing protein n=1 Tax=Thelazia callipaeda TaxID=103827 RepID=A0A0N5D3Q5_THECL|nr:unnamed protein product [Thelazia callipaeda]
MMYLLLNILSLVTVLSGRNLCKNGGEWVAHACTSDSQCEPYKARSTDRVACIESECCTIPCSNNGSHTGKTCSRSTDCLPSKEKVACLQKLCCTVPQKCPYGGEVIGLQCKTSKSCQFLAPGIPVLCLQGNCCAYHVLTPF